MSIEIAMMQEKPDAVLPTMGGQTALNLAKALSEVRTVRVAKSRAPKFEGIGN